jgi:hypothetical protein
VVVLVRGYRLILWSAYFLPRHDARSLRVARRGELALRVLRRVLGCSWQGELIGHLAVRLTEWASVEGRVIESRFCLVSFERT